MTERTGDTAAPARADRHDEACCGGHGHHPHSHDAHSRGTPSHDPDALIGARGLKIVRSGRTILTDIDLDIKAAEIVTLIGPNGAGKTTLVRTLLGLEPADQGSLSRRAGLVIGYVPQRFDIDRALPMTVARFLALGEGARADRVAAVL